VEVRVGLLPGGTHGNGGGSCIHSGYRSHTNGSPREIKSCPEPHRHADFGLALIAGLVFIGISIARDLGNIELGSAWPYLLLGTALRALGFEFVNGFHDTANAVATVIYTHSLDPNIPAVWSASGIFSAW